MPTLTPVDFDPFAEAQTGGPKLVPVDHDPFAKLAGPAEGSRAAAEYQGEPQGWGPWLEDRLRSVAQGTTFRLGDEIAAGAGAVGNKIMRAVGADVPELSYSDIKSGINADQARFEQSHPKTAMGLEIAGSLAVPGLGAGKAVQAGEAVANATRTGAIGRGLTSGALVGAPTGALYGAGASDADTLSGRAADAFEGGKFGALTGGLVSGVGMPALQVLGSAAKKAIEPYINLARGASNSEGEGMRRLATALREDTRPGVPRSVAPLSEAEIAAAQARGQPVLPLEMGGSNTRALARASANANPTARETLEAATEPRFTEQGDRTAKFLRSLGTGTTAHQSYDALEKEARALTAPPYQKAMQAGKQGIDDIDLENLIVDRPALAGPMKKADATLKNRAGIDPHTTGRDGPNGMTLEYWDAVKRHLDDDIGTAEARGEKSTMRDLLGVRDKLVGILDKHVPEYAGARQTASGFFGASNALEAGEKFATAGARYGNEAASEALKGFSAREKELFRQGYLSRMTDTAGESADRRNIVNQLASSPAARERVGMALGPTGAKELEAQLHVERLMELGRKAISGNSTTARQLVELGIGSTVGGGASYYSNDPQYLVYGALLGGRRFAAAAAEKQVALDVAKLLTSGDQTKIRQAVTKLSQSPTLLKNLRRLEAPLTGGIVSGNAQSNDDSVKAQVAALRRLNQR